MAGDVEALDGQLPGMPIRRCARIDDAERRLRAALGLSVARLAAVIAEHFAVERHVQPVMAAKATGPMPVPDVHGISVPVDAHVRSKANPIWHRSSN